jgi:hypothetical protein
MAPSLCLSPYILPLYRRGDSLEPQPRAPLYVFAPVASTVCRLCVSQALPFRTHQPVHANMVDLLVFLTFLISQASSLPEGPSPTQTLSSPTTFLPNTLSQITQPPSVHDLRPRQAANTCGFYSNLPITCNSGLPCVYDPVNNVKYCSFLGAIPVTTIFDYGYWPVTGCRLGQGCWYAFLLLLRVEISR